MKFKKGILYSLKNDLWGGNIYKIGNTGQNIKSRIATIQTSLYLNCEIVYQTNELVCCNYWEKVLENILSKYRINPKREFYCISEEEIKLIFDFFNEFNNQLDTTEKLNNYIKNNYPGYLSKKRNKIIVESNNSYESKNLSSFSDKPKRKGIYVNTSNL